MATVEAPPVRIPAEQRLLLHNISWELYELMRRELNESQVRFTYDEGALQIMTLSLEHENDGELLGRFILVLTEEFDMPVHSGGSTTFKNKARKKGLEPDKCFWIKNERLIRGKKAFDFNRDPPPDLVVEIDITSSSLDRMAIYAALRVPEVWRYDGKSILVYCLGANGKYRVCGRSPTFPDLPMEEVLRFLREGEKGEENAVVRSFRRWVREHLVPAPTATESKKADPSGSAKPRPRNGR